MPAAHTQAPASAVQVGDLRSAVRIRRWAVQASTPDTRDYGDHNRDRSVARRLGSDPGSLSGLPQMMGTRFRESVP
jgi:hypothetical protein